MSRKKAIADEELIQELKTQNVALTKQVKRLQKRTARLVQTEERHVPDEPGEIQPGPKVQNPKNCVQCGMEVTEFKMPTGVLKICKSCGHREKAS